MIDIADIYEYIAPEVMGCPEPLIERAVVKTARKLCNHSLIWDETEEILPAVATIKTIKFDVAVENTEIASIDYVKYNGFPLTVTTEQELNELVPFWPDDTGEPTHYIPNINGKTARLYPVPTTTDADAITYKVTLRPAINATQLPSFMTTDFLEVLIDGALMILMRMSKEAWYNPAESERRRKELKKGIFRVNTIKMRGYSTYDNQTSANTLV